MNKEEDLQKSNAAALEVAAASTGDDLPKSKQRIKGRYPDRSFDKDEDWEDAFNETLDEYEGSIEKSKVSEKAISDYINQYPEFEDILVDMVVNQLPPTVAIARNVDLEEFIPQEGDEGYEDYVNSKQERISKNKKISEEKAQIASNAEASWNVIDSFAADNGLDEAQVMALLEYGYSDFQNLLMQNITPEMLANWHKSLNHDSDVSAAEEAGLKNGMNTQIEKKIEKETMKKRGDGLPVSTGETPPPADNASDSVFANALNGSRIDFNKIAKRV
jgi:hypothetical protein